VAYGSFVPQADVSANKMLRSARMAAMTGRAAAFEVVANVGSGPDSNRCCAMHILALRADSRPSLQVRIGSASTARADIHIAEELSFFLHRRKAAWSPQ